MADIKISELPAATSANGSMQLETNDSGTSKRVTVAQLFDSPTLTGTVGLPGTSAFSSTGLGIGTSSPSTKLELLNAGDALITVTGNTASGNFAGIDFKRNTGTVNASVRSESVGANDAGELLLQTRPNAGSLTTQMRITSSGNIGIGTSSITAGTKLDVNGAVYSRGDIYVNATSAFITDINGGYGLKIVGGGSGSVSVQANGAIRATYDASGNFIHQVNGTAPTLSTNGTMSFELTSNTSLKIVVRGSDGVTRSATLTLS